MPSKSAKQHRFMQAIAHSPSFAKKAGVSQSVGKDFSAADKGKTFKKGGDIVASKKMMGKKMMGKKKYGMPPEVMAAMMAKRQQPMRRPPPGGMPPPAQPPMGMNKGGVAKYAKGGGIESRGKTKGTVIRMAAGGSVSARADGIAQRGKTKFKNY